MRLIIMGAIGVALVLIFDFSMGEWLVFSACVVGAWVAWKVFFAFSCGCTAAVRAEQRWISEQRLLAGDHDD